jgi:hypothetical protein
MTEQTINVDRARAYNTDDEIAWVCETIESFRKNGPRAAALV